MASGTSALDPSNPTAGPDDGPSLRSARGVLKTLKLKRSRRPARFGTLASSLAAAVTQTFEKAAVPYQPIARGGFSDVYKVLLPMAGYYALKRLTNPGADSATEATVAREMQILNLLNHPNIIHCPQISEVQGMRYIVTRWAENGTLRAYLDNHPDANRLSLLCDIARALQHLHMRPNPIVHGDIYVDNVLVSKFGSALLSDFGLSTIVFPDDSESAALGDDVGNYLISRAAYEAPERNDDPPARRSPATDVFAFGMLVFHTYSGASPFASLGNPAAILVAIYCGRRPSRTDIARDDFPDALWQLVQECWSHNPADRPTMPVVNQRIHELLFATLGQPESRARDA